MTLLFGSDVVRSLSIPQAVTISTLNGVHSGGISALMISTTFSAADLITKELKLHEVGGIQLQYSMGISASWHERVGNLENGLWLRILGAKDSVGLSFLTGNE